MLPFLVKAICSSELKSLLEIQPSNAIAYISEVGIAVDENNLNDNLLNNNYGELPPQTRGRRCTVAPIDHPPVTLEQRLCSFDY